MKKIIALVIFFGIYYMNVSAQCKDALKITCLPKLEPYIYNGQYNAIVLSEDDAAELMLTFYAGQKYRIFICSESIFNKVEFKLLDNSRKVLFSNKSYNFTNFWDFAAKTTQQIIVEITIPKSQSGGAKKTGCVNVMVGFKDE